MSMLEWDFLFYSSWLGSSQLRAVFLQGLPHQLPGKRQNKLQVPSRNYYTTKLRFCILRQNLIFFSDSSYHPTTAYSLSIYYIVINFLSVSELLEKISSFPKMSLFQMSCRNALKEHVKMGRDLSKKLLPTYTTVYVRECLQ